MKLPGAVAVVLAALLLAACAEQPKLVAPELTLARMVDQRRVAPYAPSDAFPDGAAMRVPPADTVPRDALPPDSPVLTGQGGAGFLRVAPLPVDRALLRRGQERYGIACTPCHGALGDGAGPVAPALTKVKPRNLLVEPSRSYPIGRLVAVIRGGYGLMPGYASLLGPRDAWAVAAYVQALQVAAAVRLEALPAATRRQALEQLP
jgi:mono/diheme cytochrome c family protein